MVINVYKLKDEIHVFFLSFLPAHSPSTFHGFHHAMLHQNEHAQKITSHDGSGKVIRLTIPNV